MSARSAIRPLLLLGLCACAAPPLPAATAAGAPPTPLPAPTRAVIAALDACVRRLDPELDVGLARIEPLCPGLAATLETAGVAALLPADWKRPRSELSAGGLRALRRWLAESASMPAGRTAPDARRLQALAAGAGVDTGAGPWERFTRWLRSLVEGLDAGPESAGPFSRFGELSVPQRAWTLLGYLAVLGLLAFAAWVVRGELRAAGLLGRPVGTAAASADAASADAELAPGTLAAVAPLERPAWLLRQISARLQQLGRLPPPGPLTPREVASGAQLDRAADREPLQAIATAAERVRFGALPPPAPADLEPAVAAAAGLLDRLRGTGGSADAVAPVSR